MVTPPSEGRVEETRGSSMNHNLLSRRVFVNWGAALPLAALVAKQEAFADALGFKNTGMQAFANRPFSKNLYIAFNPINNPEKGESDEYTTMRNLERILGEMKVPQGSHIIGIGARSGVPGAPYAMPGEMGYFWKYGSEWDGKITSPADATPLPFGLDDPITVTQVGILDPESAHRITFDDASERGKVLWSLENDETTYPVVKRGFHNMFSIRDGGMIETIYEAGQAAQKQGPSWATNVWRKKLTVHIPDLAEDVVWENFKATFPRGLLHERCHTYVKEQGWQGAAVVLKGKVSNVAQFHLMEWNRHSPNDPELEFGKGIHLGPLKVRLGREVRPFINKGETDWTMVGFIWDMAASSQPMMSHWQDASDIFGNDFHIHGFRDDGVAGGHSLFAMLGAGEVSIDLYPLNFMEDAGAYCLNNDLEVISTSLAQFSEGLQIKIRNNGEMFARNVRVDLNILNNLGIMVDRNEGVETVVIPELQPRQEMMVSFTGKNGKNADRLRQVVIDPEGNFKEGNSGRGNNALRFDRKLRPLGV